MSKAAVAAVQLTSPKGGRWTAAVLSLVLLVGAVFIVAVAVPYYGLDQARFGAYWPLRGWLLVHITTGLIALLTGPPQLWTGLTDRYPRLHHQMGFGYIASVAVSSVAAYYLALHTSGGWVFGAGLAGLATAWLVTTGMALLTIKRHLYEQHKEWMIRSYVVTFGFVTFRVLSLALNAAAVGTVPERLGVSAWFCWSVPLLVAEAVMQGRKALAVRPD